MRRFLLLAVIMVLAVTPAFAQPMSGKFELGMSGGVNMPVGDLGDGTKTGYVIGASAGYHLMPMLVVGAEFAYYGNGATDDVLAALGPGADMNTNFTQYTAMVKFMVPVLTKHNLYAKGVAGAYTATVDFQNMPPLGSGSVSDTNMGFGIGGGIRLNGDTKYSLFAEGMFHHVTGESESAELVTASAGVLISLP